MQYTLVSKNNHVWAIGTDGKVRKMYYEKQGKYSNLNDAAAALDKIGCNNPAYAKINIGNNLSCGITIPEKTVSQVRFVLKIKNMLEMLFK